MFLGTGSERSGRDGQRRFHARGAFPAEARERPDAHGAHRPSTGKLKLWACYTVHKVKIVCTANTGEARCKTRGMMLG